MGLLNSISFSILLMISVPAFSAQELICQKYLIRVPSETSPFERKFDACADEKITLIFSKACKEKCMIDEAISNYKGKLSLSAGLGNPNFQICKDIGGRPELIQIKKGKDWYDLDWCRFSSTGDFADTGTIAEKLNKLNKAEN